MKMKPWARNCSLLAVALMCAPATAQEDPNGPKDVQEARQSPGGEERQQNRRSANERTERDRGDIQRRGEREERNQRGDRNNRGDRPDRVDRDSTQGRQYPGENRREQAAGDRQERGQRNASDQLMSNFLTGKLILMNQSIVDMSQMAQERASSEEVKQFAQQLAESHTQLTHKLQSVSPQVTAIVAIEGVQQRTAGYRGVTADQEQNAEQKADRQNKPEHADKGDHAEKRDHKEHAQHEQHKKEHAVRDRDQESNTADNVHPQELRTDRMVQNRIAQGPLQRILELERNATQNYIQASNKMLDQYQGQDFDMGFLGFQIGCHTWALAELDAMEKAGDEEFKNVVADVKSHMEKHLQKAKELAKKYEDKESGSRQ